MIQVLYGGSEAEKDEHGLPKPGLAPADHQKRGEALARITPGAHCGHVSKPPLKKPDLDTLTFWGHGDASKFCDLTSGEFVKVVSDWKKLNKTLKTVEIITCNARHATGNAGSFTKQVVPLLRKKHKDIAVKALPMGVGLWGETHIWSILLFSTVTHTWCYVTAPGKTDTEYMWPGVHKVKAEAKARGEDLAAGAKVVEGREKSRKYSLMYGSLDQLRPKLTWLHK